MRQLESERDELQTEHAQFTQRRHRKAITLSGSWEDMDVFAKRAVIQSVIEAVVVRPVGRRGVYDPSRVDVVPLQSFRQSPSPALSCEWWELG